MARRSAICAAAAVVAAALVIGAHAFKEQDFKVRSLPRPLARGGAAHEPPSPCSSHRHTHDASSRHPPNNPPALTKKPQKCATNNFCARNRGRTGTRYAILPGSLALADDGRALHAVLRDGAADGATFNLTLRAYRGPMVRVLVDEFPAPDDDGAAAEAAAAAAKKAEEEEAAKKKKKEEGAADSETVAAADAEAAADPPAPPAVLPPEARRRKPRYQLPDILEPGLETPSASARWSSVAETKHTWTGTIAADRTSDEAAVATVRVTLDPFKVELFVGSGPDNGSGPTTATTSTQEFAPSAVLNARGMFHVERTRREGKRDGDAAGLWEESFNGHADSKPRGPQAISLDLTFPGAAHVYGLPERATGLALRPTAAASPLGRPAAGSAYSEPYRLYNLDVFEYLDDSPFGLYGSIPYMVAHRAEKAGNKGAGGGGGGGGKKAGGGGGGGASSSSSSPRLSTTVGAAWINAAEQYVDLSAAKDGTSAQWIAESGVLDLFLLAGPTPLSVSRQLAAVAGTTALPQYFALGYHQCRWNYRDEDDVREVDAGFDAHAIPYDVLWLDIEHTDGKRCVRRPRRHRAGGGSGARASLSLCLSLSLSLSRERERGSDRRRAALLPPARATKNAARPPPRPASSSPRTNTHPNPPRQTHHHDNKTHKTTTTTTTTAT
jgi:hypothetical protein